MISALSSTPHDLDGSIHHALKQMAEQGLLHAHEIAPSTAGPPRTEYEITGHGTEEWRESVTEYYTPRTAPDSSATSARS